MSIVDEDASYFDLTTLGLGIGEKQGRMSFEPKSAITLCGLQRVSAMLRNDYVEFTTHKQDGDTIGAGEVFLECKADAKTLHKLWKITQNTLEYQSGIASYTRELLRIAKEINPYIMVATTRKNFPGAKELMLQSVMCGGGVAHRIGLFDSILVFKEHLVFLDSPIEIQIAIANLKQRFIEKKITVEVESYDEARHFATLGVDILQCEKMNFEELKRCVGLKVQHPALLVSATGGINEHNIAQYTECGVDFVVTSSPYHAKPAEIKVRFNQV